MVFSSLRAPMANTPLLSSLCLIHAALFFSIFFFPFLAFAISSCNGPCRTFNDCDGRLTCINGKCNDDPDVGTDICGGVPSPPPPNPSGDCQSSGTLSCRGQSHPTYTCSPRITSSTAAVLLTNDFSEGGNGGGPSECDGEYQNNSDLIVALSTGWYNGGLLCGKKIKIMAGNGRSVLAKVVDECDSLRGCDDEHSGQPPCGNNIINGSDAVWSALGLDKELGETNVTWSKVMDAVGCDQSNTYVVHIM